MRYWHSGRKKEDVISPDEIVLQARQSYNAVGDTFFSDTELYNLIYDAELILAMETKCMEDTASTSTVASQLEYAKPTNCLSIRRVTYNGIDLFPINMTEEVAVTAWNQATTATGTPTYYVEWGDSIFLRPIPNAVQTLKMWFYVEPQEVSATSTLELPTRYHLKLIDYLLQHMFGKDGKADMAAYHQQKWLASVQDVGRWEARLKRGNAHAIVNNVEMFSELARIV